VLTEHRWFGRRTLKIGDGGGSESALDIKRNVKAWYKGGPVPVLDEDTKHKKHAPIIRLVINNNKGHPYDQ